MGRAGAISNILSRGFPILSDFCSATLDSWTYVVCIFRIRLRLLHSPFLIKQAVVLLTMDDTSARFAASAAGPLLVELLRLHGARHRQAAFWLLQVCDAGCARVYMYMHSRSLSWNG